MAFRLGEVLEQGRPGSSRGLGEILQSACTLDSTSPASWLATSSDQGQACVCLCARAGQGSLALAGDLVKISKYQVPGLDCPG